MTDIQSIKDEYQININKLTTKAINEVEIRKLPDDVSISTMTITCALDTEFLCGNIARYIDLKSTGILSVSNGKFGDPQTNRTIIDYKRGKKGKTRRNKKVFYNQVSMNVSITSKKKKPVNIKLFSNGAIQMTGCKTVENAIDTLAKILPELQPVKAIIDYKEMKVIDKPFVLNADMLNIKYIKNIKIAMINSGFKLPFKIDRGKLYNLLLSENYDCFFDPGKHAAVNVKFLHPDKTITIFIFEKGSIIITGGRNCSQIADAYNFINKYLIFNYKHIVKNDALMNSNIIKYLDPKNIITIDSDNFSIDDLSD
jgi:TATA-box binding protein (TBP) (component of TFIID and TFIIIB)